MDILVHAIVSAVILLGMGLIIDTIDQVSKQHSKDH